MRTIRITCAAGVCAGIMAISVAGDLDAQVTTGPLKNVHGCLRPDVEKTKELLTNAMAKGGVQDDVQEVQKEVKGCTAYTVTFQSAVNIVSNAPTGGTRKIAGTGSITFGLAPDPSEPDYDLTSGPSELTAPVYWTGAGITMGNKCIVQIVPLPYSSFSFWLGVKSGPQPKAAVQISPAGDELHPTLTKCPRPMGAGYTKEVPGRESIFSPAWTGLHGHGKRATGVTAGAMPQQMDMEKMKAAASQAPAMDMAKLQQMAEKLKGKEPTPENMQEMMKMMGQVVPDADQQLEAARNNFMLKMPGECVPAAALVAKCTINRTVTVPDGLGTTQTITENTIITIAKATPKLQ